MDCLDHTFIKNICFLESRPDQVHPDFLCTYNIVLIIFLWNIKRNKASEITQYRFWIGLSDKSKVLEKSLVILREVQFCGKRYYEIINSIILFTDGLYKMFQERAKKNF